MCSIRLRDYLLKKARKTTSSEDWENHRCSKNRVTNNMKTAKGGYRSLAHNVKTVNLEATLKFRRSKEQKMN